MSAPIVLYTSKNLLPFFPKGTLKNIHYQLSVDQTKEVMDELSLPNQVSDNSRKLTSQKIKQSIFYGEMMEPSASKKFPTTFHPIKKDDFQSLFDSMVKYSERRAIFVRDGTLPISGEMAAIKIRVVSENPETDAFFRHQLKNLPSDNFTKTPDLYIINFEKYSFENSISEYSSSDSFMIIGYQKRPVLLCNILDHQQLVHSIKNLAGQLFNK